MFLSFIVDRGYAQTSTVAPGNWNTAANWSNGVPAAMTVTTVGNSMVLDVNVSFQNAGYTFNSPVIDPVGGTNYTFAGSGSSGAVLDINANATFGGGGSLTNSSSMIIRSGDTLTMGYPGSTQTYTFDGATKITIEAGGVLLVYGNINSTNSNTNQVDGQIIVNGSYTVSGGAATTGSGSVSATNGITTNNSTKVFGNSVSCSSNCSTSTTTCATSTITPSQTICSGNSPATLTGNALSGYTYKWQQCTTSPSGTYTDITSSMYKIMLLER